MKNRTELMRLLKDAKDNKFQLVLIKDVSRLARNTVDFLTSIRKLKSYGIQVIFVNYDQTSSQSSEFMLTMLSAIAQEESANTSKRVKFGKTQNAIRGRVPNFIYGYDKIPGDYFNLKINEKEAAVIKRIFYMYTEKMYGTNQIAKELNKEGIGTKRGCNWTQNTVKRILSNPIYIGVVINGKEEVMDFLTGARVAKEKEDWHIVQNKNLIIMNEDTFKRANEIRNNRQNAFHIKEERNIDTYPFSKLIYCNQCNTSFRRIVRTYRNTYIRWVCNTRNSSGVDACNNSFSIKEEELLNAIIQFMKSILMQYKQSEYLLINELYKQYENADEKEMMIREYNSKLQKCIRKRERYKEMYSNDLISLEELKEEIQELHEDIIFYQEELDKLRGDTTYEDKRSEQINIDSILQSKYINNHILKRIIDKIIVDSSGKVEVYIKEVDEL